MCGIIGYIGYRNAPEVVLRALTRAETRGYHGDGIGVLNPDKEGFEVRKIGGEDCMDEFVQLMKSNPLPATTIAIGHNRWATHGGPCDRNSHPHLSTDGQILLAHNGIIENADALLKEMKMRNFPIELKSETDTEILVNWIAFIKSQFNLTMTEALQTALKQVQGTYAIVCMENNNRDMLFTAVCGRTLRIGIGKGEHFISSEVYPFMEYTQNFAVIPSKHIVTVTREFYKVINFEGLPFKPEEKQLVAELEDVSKGGYKHWMLKEIMEQPSVITTLMMGRVLPNDSKIYLKGIAPLERKIANADRIYVVAHGTSYCAALFFKYIFEEMTGINVNVELASEFRYRKKGLKPTDIIIGISQSGETADTIGALEHAKELGTTILGICNVEGSQIAEMTSAGIFLRAGRENGVASTKAFTAQLVTLLLFALRIAKIKDTIDDNDYDLIFEGLKSLSIHLEKTLEMIAPPINALIEKYNTVQSMYYLGRGVNYPIALEGALKLKEIAGIHAEGYSASEMKHGPIGLIGPSMPVMVIATEAETFSKMVTTVKESKARKAPIIAVVSEGSNYEVLGADDYIVVPKVLENLSPVINVLPLQLFAYLMALKKGKNPDKPIGLAKSVTVE